MVVTAWRNGNPNGLTGSGYGLRVRKAGRDEHFRRDWNEVHLLLEGEEVYRNVSVGNESFWNDCSELRSNAIGQWFLQHGLSDWPQGRPHRFVLTPVRGSQFTLHLPQNG